MAELNFLGLNVDKCEMVIYICFYRIPNYIFMNTSNKFVITINREIGSGGKTIGKLLAQKLGVPLYDRAHLSTLEDKEGLNEEEIERLKKKKRTWWPDLKKIVAPKRMILTRNSRPSRRFLRVLPMPNHAW